MSLIIRKYGEKVPAVSDQAWVADTADLIGDVELAAGASVWFGAILRGDMGPIRIGRSSNVQDGCILHTDQGCQTVVGDYVTIGHRAVLHSCEVRDRALIGMGAVVLDGAVIGEGALVGAGAVVPPGFAVPAGALALGAPVRIVRDLGCENAIKQEKWAKQYQRLWESGYRSHTDVVRLDTL